jgi:anti-anti-sigma regulatory factor
MAVQSQGPLSRVGLRGEFDLAQLDFFARNCREIDAAESTRVDFDLRGLEFIDLDAARALCRQIRRAAQGRRIHIAPARKSVMRTLRLVDADGRY